MVGNWCCKLVTLGTGRTELSAIAQALLLYQRQQPTHLGGWAAAAAITIFEHLPQVSEG